jgi:hypothetical protein
MNGSGARQDAGTPACFKCSHYHVTWDAQAPYGCRAHGFKSNRNPAAAVYEASGSACQLFERKTGTGTGRGPERT